MPEQKDLPADLNFNTYPEPIALGTDQKKEPRGLNGTTVQGIIFGTNFTYCFI